MIRLFVMRCRTCILPWCATHAALLAYGNACPFCGKTSRWLR